MSILAQASGADALALAVVLAIIYMVIVRFMDLNEKEPLWAMGMVFGIGFFAAMLLYLSVSSVVLETNLVLGPIVREVVKIVAVGLGIGALEAIGRGRGWTEVDGALDGIVYGTAVGLGFATGAVFVSQLSFGAAGGGLLDAAAGGTLGQLWPLALRGLSEGVFGGIIGVGFALAASRARSQRPLYIGGGAVAAIVLHVAYEVMRRGFGLTSAGRVLQIVGLLLPLVIIIGIVVWSLRQERRVITTELSEEKDAGVITDDDMSLLTSFAARRGAYLKRLTSGDIDGWGDLKSRHNRQVQLAFAKDRARRGDPDAAGEVERLRAALYAMGGAPPAAPPAAPATNEGAGA